MNFSATSSLVKDCILWQMPALQVTMAKPFHCYETLQDEENHDYPVSFRGQLDFNHIMLSKSPVKLQMISSV